MKQKDMLMSILFLVILGFIVYGVFQQNWRITPEKAFNIASNTINPPPQATPLGVKTLNTTTNQNYIVAWKITYKALDPREGMLIEVQVTKKGEIQSIIHYPLTENEYMANISKILAYQIAEETLQNILNTPSSHNTGIPTIYYAGRTWDITWEKTIEDYIIPEATFRVKIDANTGSVILIDNKLDIIQNITPPNETNIKRIIAIQIAETHIINQLKTGYHVENPQIRGPTITEKILIERPRDTGQYTPAWTVITRADCIKDGKIVTLGASITIDAQTGEIVNEIIT